MTAQPNAAAVMLPAYAQPKEWARISGLSRSFTYTALAAGHLTARRVGGRTLIDVSAGLAWIAAQEVWTPQKGAC